MAWAERLPARQAATIGRSWLNSRSHPASQARQIGAVLVGKVLAHCG